MLLVLPPPWLLPLHLPLLPGLLVPPLVLHLQPFWVANMLAGWAWAPLLFLPLRLALTGQPHGPEMAALLPLIGRDEALRRLAP
jgi:hypothetical protein